MKNIATAIVCILSIAIYAQELDHVNELFFEAVEYTVQFNASGLTSGTYIYTLTTNGNRISKKLSVMK